jgi:hypothetical protein
MDFGKHKDAASDRKAVVWAIEEYHKLELKDALAFICDNTNSNSGTGKVGGFVVQISRQHGVPMFRIPCTGIFFSSSFLARPSSVSFIMWTPHCVRDRVPRSRFFQVARDVFLAQITYCILAGVPVAYTSWASSRKSLEPLLAVLQRAGQAGSKVSQVITVLCCLGSLF